MTEPAPETNDLGDRIAHAADNDDVTVVASLIRGGQFIVFQLIDMESGDIEEDAEGNFAVMLAEVDEDHAVVCFSNQEAASDFATEIGEELPAGRELPAVMLDGDTLLDGLPEDCGLLINPGTEVECYFPPGSLEAA